MKGRERDKWIAEHTISIPFFEGKLQCCYVEYPEGGCHFEVHAPDDVPPGLMTAIDDWWNRTATDYLEKERERLEEKANETAKNPTTADDWSALSALPDAELLKSCEELLVYVLDEWTGISGCAICLAPDGGDKMDTHADACAVGRAIANIAKAKGPS